MTGFYGMEIFGKNKCLGNAIKYTLIKIKLK